MIWTTLLVILQVYLIHAQIPCYNGVLVYEKSSATSVRPESRADRTIEVSPTEAPTSTCQRVCDGTPSCTAYSVDYSTRTCKTYSETIAKTRFTSRPDSAFFQKICLPEVPRDFIRMKCGDRLWTIERVRGSGFQAAIMRMDQNVASRETCVRSCLAEVNFECASVVYDEVARACSLSVADRRTTPMAIVDDIKSSDYMENQCLSVSRSCQYLRQNDVNVISVDYVSDARDEEQCQLDCTMNKAIVCRSYSYDLQRNICELSSDDSISIQGVELLKENGRRYAERRCQHGSPQLHLETNYQQFPQPPNYGSMTSTGLVPMTSIQGNVYPGISRFDQFDNQDPRLFNQRPGGFQTTGFGGINPFVSPERCFLEKSTGLSVVAEPQGIIPTNGFFTRGVAAQCSSWCRMQGPFKCPAFTVDYNSNRCGVLSRPAEVALAPGMAHGQSYLEHVCFNDYYRACEGKTWAFERTVNSELRGFDDRIIPSVTSRKDCEETCLRETSFLCLSAEYDGSRSVCRLSRDSRITKPYSIQPAPNIDYLENQCVPPNTLSSCAPQRQTGLTLLYADASLSQVFSEEECRRACFTFPNFTCNAASYRQVAQECLLSSDATAVALPDAILLYTSCVQLNQVAPQSPTNFGQFSNVPYGSPNFNAFTPQFQTPSSSSFPGSRYPISGTSPNSFSNTNLFPGINIGGGSAGLPQYPGVSQQFPIYGQQFPGSVQQFPGSGQQFPVSGQQFPGSGQQFPGSGQQFPGSGQQFPGSVQFPGSGQQFPNSVQFPGPGQQFPGSVQQFPNTGQQFPILGQQFPISGQQFPISGQQFPVSGQQFPISGQQFPISGQQFPTSSQQFPISGQQFPLSSQQFPLSSQQFPLSSQQFPLSNQQFPSQSSGFFPNNPGAQGPFTMNPQFGPQFPFQRPSGVTRSPLMRPNRVPNRDFLHQTPSIPLLIPGRSTSNMSTTFRPQSADTDTDHSSGHIQIETFRKNPSKDFPFTSDTQPK